MLRILFFAVIMLLNLKLYSFDLTPLGNVRYRFEFWDGMNQKNFGYSGENAIGKLNDKIIFQRIIAGFRFASSTNFVFVVSLQDSRAFGSSLTSNDFKIGTKDNYYIMNPNEEFFDFNNLYVEVDSIFGYTNLTLGRQKIAYGDFRAFGPGEWGNTGRWCWDALKLQFKKGTDMLSFWIGGTKIHNPKVTSFPFFNTEYYGFGSYSSLQVLQDLKFEPFFAGKFQGSARYIKDQKISLYWAGLRILDSNVATFLIDLTGAYEFGKKNTNTVSAYAYFAKLGRWFSTSLIKAFLSLRYTFASGGLNSDGSNAKFEPIYGANDKYYGWMNVVSWSNLRNPEMVLELYIGKNFWSEIKYNWFFVNDVNEKILGLSVGQSKHLGNEFDIFANYKFSKRIAFTSVFGFFQPIDCYTKDLSKPKNAYYFSLQVLFQLFRNNFGAI
ncbi:hypothetical protein D9V84_04495 [Bacteroidetes/Chlorobi group bacterium Naka2016]|nr:MAG: hypothetical protein D9V84_04495 [Bacteroidetes/Chlorobi group bacterium Naka2016]